MDVNFVNFFHLTAWHPGEVVVATPPFQIMKTTSELGWWYNPWWKTWWFILQHWKNGGQGLPGYMYLEYTLIRNMMKPFQGSRSWILTNSCNPKYPDPSKAWRHFDDRTTPLAYKTYTKQVQTDLSIGGSIDPPGRITMITKPSQEY